MENKDSHKQILKTTGIVGGSQILSIIINVLRTKVVALLLGPSGMGILGILQSATDLVRSATSFGIGFSGVKDISEACGSGDQQRIDRTITIVRRWVLGTGLLGMLITVILCIPLSNYSFGNDSYALSISILSITLLITSISVGQSALLQGLRKINQLAKTTFVGAVLGTVITLPMYWWLGKEGIVPGMILTAIGGFLVSWYYARKIKVISPSISFKETFWEGWSMAKLGFFIVVTGFIAAATMYATRTFIASKLNLDAVGHFQASWMISKTYIGIVLSAMLADFFPRLSSVNKDNIASNKLINEQLEMALIVGVPMIIMLCAFANLLILILYSSSFGASVSLLQWQMCGSFLTLISWPLGVMFLSKGKGIFSIVNDSIWLAVYLLCLYFGWDYWGFNTLGIAFLIASIVNTTSVIISVRYLGRFSFSKTNKVYIVYGFLAISLVFINILIIHGIYQYIVSTLVLMVSLIFSYFKLREIININKFIKSKVFKNR
jgi:enterobacterial common antigen flippase